MANIACKLDKPIKLIQRHYCGRRKMRWADPESFVMVWQTASSLEDVVDTLRSSGVTEQSLRHQALQARAKRYREEYSIPLKRLRTPPSLYADVGTDWDALRQYAVELASGSETT